MIIDDVHKMAFVHIPKCAGTSVRRQLEPLDTTGGVFYPMIDHPVLGKIHGSHIPLAFVREHYPTEFAKLATYQTFALIREPLARFASAAFQRLKGHHRVTPGEITPALAVREAMDVMEWLQSRSSFCDPGYIHFARQCDYVCVDGRRIVGNLYVLEDMAEFATAIEQACGVRLDPERRENANFASSNPVTRHVRRVLRPLYRRLTSWEMRQKLLLKVKEANAGRDEPLYEAFRSDPGIRSFVERYYAEDWEIYTALRRPDASRTPLSRGPAAVPAAQLPLSAQE